MYIDNNFLPSPPLSHQSNVEFTQGLPQVKVVQLQRDNEKGLGFNVAEGGQEGVVIVSSITPGGPAEKVSIMTTRKSLNLTF